MFSRLEPFGATQSALDPAKITVIRVGWGGYCGLEGGRIGIVVNPARLSLYGAN